MKYAFIAIIVVYLFTYGCINDNTEEHTDDSHEVTQTAADHSAQPKHEAATAQHAEETPAPEAHATVDEKTDVTQYENVAQAADDTIKALISGDAEAQAEKHAAPAVGEEKAEPVVEQKQAPAVAEEKAEPVVEEKHAPAVAEEKTEPVVEQKQTTNVAIDKSDAYIEGEIEKVEITPPSPCTRTDTPKEAAVAPCGKVGVAPCGKPCPAGPAQVQSPETMPANADLNAAMAKMVEATNDMVMITRQLVFATQQMLVATKGAEDTAAATQEVIKATEEAIETAVEAQKQQ